MSEFDIEGSPTPAVSRLRPALIWLGLAAFFVGAILLGGTLAQGGSAFVGPVLLLAGVALVGGGFAVPPSEFEYDPEVEFDGWRWALVCLLSALAGLLALAAVVLAAV